MVLTDARQVFGRTRVKHLQRLASMLTKQASTLGMSLEHASITIASSVVALVIVVES